MISDHLVCSGVVLMGEIHRVPDPVCHSPRCNQPDHRFYKQLPEDAITPKGCFYTSIELNTSEKQRPAAARSTVDPPASVGQDVAQNTLRCFKLQVGWSAAHVWRLLRLVRNV